MVMNVNKDNFAELIQNNDIVVVDFWAPWCGPCKSFAPTFEAFAQAHKDEAIFAKVNTEEEEELAAHFQIRSIPTLMVFREQVVVFMQPGVLPESALEQLLEQVKTLDMVQVRREISEYQEGGR